MHVSTSPIVGETSPTFPPKPELTPEDAIEIASVLLARRRRRRLGRLGGFNKLRALGGDHS